MTTTSTRSRTQTLVDLLGRIPRRVAAVVAVVVVLALVAGVTLAVIPSSAPLPYLTSAQRHYLSLAEQGVSQTSRWWDQRLDWYLDTLGDHQSRPLTTLWDSNGLFEALDEIALAQPSSQNLAAVKAFANGSERYWNPDLKPIPGYAPYPGDRSPNQQTWFDDNGWIGLGFVDAYKVTQDTRYLTDAERAFNFIATEGWDARQGGGIWWTTAHAERSNEALAAAADLAARLYQTTHKATYLTAAEEYIGWVDKHMLNSKGVYIAVASTPYPYLVEPKNPPAHNHPTGTRTLAPGKCPQGSPICSVVRCSGGPSQCPVVKCPRNGQCVVVKCPKDAKGCKPGQPISQGGSVNPHGSRGPKIAAMPHDGEGAMLAAKTTLCEATGKQSWCRAAEKLAAAEITWLAPFADGSQYDSVLVRGVLTLYAQDHKARWYRFAVAIARLIEKNARTAPGVYLRGWDGRSVPSALPGMLRTDAGSIAVFADLATVRPPAT